MKFTVFLVIFLSACGLFGGAVVEKATTAFWWYFGKAMQAIGGASSAVLLPALMKNFKLLHGNTLDKNMAAAPLPPASTETNYTDV